MATTNAAIAEGIESAKTLVQRVARSFYGSRQCILLDQLIRREACVFVPSLPLHLITLHVIVFHDIPSRFAVERARIDKVHPFRQQNARRRTRWQSRNAHQGPLQDCTNPRPRSDRRSVSYAALVLRLDVHDVSDIVDSRRRRVPSRLSSARITTWTTRTPRTS